MSQGLSTFLLQRCSCPWGSGQMHYLANVPEIEHSIATKVLMPMGVWANALFG